MYLLGISFVGISRLTAPETPSILHEIYIKNQFFNEVARGGWDLNSLYIYLLIYSKKLTYLLNHSFGLGRRSPPKRHEQGYIKLLAKALKNKCEWIHFQNNFTKNELFPKYFSRILFESKNIYNRTKQETVPY